MFEKGGEMTGNPKKKAEGTELMGAEIGEICKTKVGGAANQGNRSRKGTEKEKLDPRPHLYQSYLKFSKML